VQDYLAVAIGKMNNGTNPNTRDADPPVALGSIADDSEVQTMLLVSIAQSLDSIAQSLHDISNEGVAAR
jgi:hypothetical protein